ncbi:MAG: peptide deformylase [Defluviitaleaceae bacterium]|nr:peptide deformylase [Defluviitaleaceae bacterium]
MALRQLRFEGDEILRKKAKPVKKIDEKIITLLDDMRETLHDRNGVGLAAPQIGVLKRIAIVENEDEFYEFINPEIIASEGTQISNEACLSVPGRQGDIERPMKITVEALNRDGETFQVEAEEYMASVFCHEFDHLDGVLYLDRAENIRPYNPDTDTID